MRKKYRDLKKLYEIKNIQQQEIWKTKCSEKIKKTKDMENGVQILKKKKQRTYLGHPLSD